ncbi:MAG: ATP synthase F1 subunit delta [Oscillospiraceae bacterium]|nr:ATP synthase F1 subunit delta [Oscillospiraceae bacterium]
MTGVGNVYGEALYSLAREENAAREVLDELTVLEQSFLQEPGFLRLLASPNITKQERCAVLDESFRGRVHPYVLNFLKILTEKGYIRQFSECCEVCRELYDKDNDILRVTAVSAVPLSAQQTQRLTEKLSGMTGKNIALVSRVDPAVLGGMRLDYDGKRIDDTVAHRLDTLRGLLQNTVL